VKPFYLKKERKKEKNKERKKDCLFSQQRYASRFTKQEVGRDGLNKGCVELRGTARIGPKKPCFPP
jgi:hypothetical protein